MMRMIFVRSLFKEIDGKVYVTNGNVQMNMILMMYILFRFLIYYC